VVAATGLVVVGENKCGSQEFRRERIRVLVFGSGRMKTEQLFI